MKKIAIIIIFLFIIIVGSMLFLKDDIRSLLTTGNLSNENTEIVKEKTQEEKDTEKANLLNTQAGNESRKKFEEDPVLVASRTSLLLKNIIEDESLSKEKRSTAVNDLATLYCGFSRNDDVLPAIYNGEYEKFFVEGKPGFSSRNMLEWGYDNFEETPRMAIQIAHHGVKDLVKEKNDSSTKTFSDESSELQTAKNYLSEAQKSILEGYEFKSSRDYYSYKFWLAFTEASIAYLENDNEKYKDIYPGMILELEASPKNSIRDYIPYAYLHNAIFASLAGGEKKDIEAMVQKIIINSKTHLDNNNEFTQYIENLPSRKPESRDMIDQGFYDLAKEFNNLDEYMNEIIQRDESKSKQ